METASRRGLVGKIDNIALTRNFDSGSIRGLPECTQGSGRRQTVFRTNSAALSGFPRTASASIAATRSSPTGIRAFSCFAVDRFQR